MSPTAPDPNNKLDLLFLGKTVSIFLRNDGVASSRSLGDYVCSNLKRRSSDIQWSSRGKTLKAIELTRSSRFVSILIRFYFSNRFGPFDILITCLERPPSATRSPLAASLNYLEKKESEYLRENTQHCLYHFQNFTSTMRSRPSVINMIRNAWVGFDENLTKLFNICGSYSAEFKESHSAIKKNHIHLRLLDSYTTIFTIAQLQPIPSFKVLRSMTDLHYRRPTIQATDTQDLESSVQNLGRAALQVILSSLVLFLTPKFSAPSSALRMDERAK